MPTTPPPRHATALPPAVSTTTVILVLGIGILVLALILGLVYLTGPDGRTETLQWLSGVFAVVASVTSGGVAVQVSRVRREQASAANAVDVVREQTNGGLDQRIRSAVSDALSARRTTDGEG